MIRENTLKQLQINFLLHNVNEVLLHNVNEVFKTATQVPLYFRKKQCFVNEICHFDFSFCTLVTSHFD